MRIVKETYRVAVSGKAITGRCYCGDVTGRIAGDKGCFCGIPFGNLLRGQVGRRDIFRRRIGNGFAGSIAHRVYQDRFKYFVPSTITHPNGDASRIKFKAAMQAWKELSPEEKQFYRDIAVKQGGIPQQNIFVKRYMKGEI